MKVLFTSNNQTNSEAQYCVSEIIVLRLQGGGTFSGGGYYFPTNFPSQGEKFLENKPLG